MIVRFVMPWTRSGVVTSVSDVLEPLLLAREVGFRVLPVPLFETLEDLQNAPLVIQELLGLPERHTPQTQGASR